MTWPTAAPYYAGAGLHHTAMYASNLIEDTSQMAAIDVRRYTLTALYRMTIARELRGDFEADSRRTGRVSELLVCCLWGGSISTVLGSCVYNLVAPPTFLSFNVPEHL